MAEIDDLKARLRKDEQGLLDKFSDRVRHVERLRPAVGIIGLVGTLLVALSRWAPDVWSLGLTVLGAAVAAVCGGVLIVMDFKKLEISQEAKDAHRLADDAVKALEGRSLEVKEALAKVDAAAAFDRKRLARIEASRTMIEAVEAAFLNVAEPAVSAQALLRAAIAPLRNAVDYQAGDFLTFTIFKRTGEGRAEVMEPIAREWTDSREEMLSGRSWKRGEGYTGCLWTLAKDNRAASVVEADTQTSDAQGRYKVKGADPKREGRYRSVASFPILIGEGDDIWGVVTATSDRIGVFAHTGDLARQSVETVRDVAIAASLLAKLRAP